MNRLSVLPIAGLALLASTCMQPEGHKPKEPLGYMPSVVTTAQPEWIPWRVRAGKPVPSMDAREKHFKELRQLTFGGDNAEAYFSPDGKKLIFQSTRDGWPCDQEFTMDLGTGETKRISSGKGRTTCGYFYPKNDRILYSTTEAAGPNCPPKPDRSQGYVWPLEDLDIMTAKPDGSGLMPLIAGPGYDAETTIAPDGSRLVFTSTRDGDLDLYTASLDGKDIRRITNTLGYDGGAFFSPDSTKIVWRASRPEGDEIAEYKALLAKHVVKPTKLEIFMAGSEGQNPKQITKNGKANFGPSFFPDSRRVIFASNYDALPPSSGQPPNFDLYVVDPDAAPAMGGYPAQERITFYDGFDGFPMFSPDGDYLVFASNRFGSVPGETNIFIARWVD